jgi:hypothetical protein
MIYNQQHPKGMLQTNDVAAWPGLPSGNVNKLRHLSPPALARPVAAFDCWQQVAASRRHQALQLQAPLHLHHCCHLATACSGAGVKQDEQRNQVMLALHALSHPKAASAEQCKSIHN